MVLCKTGCCPWEIKPIVIPQISCENVTETAAEIAAAITAAEIAVAITAALFSVMIVAKNQKNSAVSVILHMH